MTALLIYRTADPAVMAWAADYHDRAVAVAKERWRWMAELYDVHQVAEEDRAAFLRDDTWFSGVSWPDGMEVPTGWRRTGETPKLIAPRLSTKVGKAARTAMDGLSTPDMRAELAERGMPAVVFVGLSMLRAGIRTEDDGVWVSWGDKRVAEQVLVRGGEHGDHGWVRVPLVEFIERFGEDAL